MIRLILLLFVIALPIAQLPAKDPGNLPLSSVGTWQPSTQRININNISTSVWNDGWSDRDHTPSNASFFFPRRIQRTAMFQSGLLWGAKASGVLHVGGSTYDSGLQPGRILSSGNAEEDPALPKNRVYRVRPDYLTADLSTEAQEEGATQEQVRVQYATDWSQWPAREGAPFKDRNSNGVYEPDQDIPGVRDADQTIWFVANDLDSSRTQDTFGTEPLGMEMQVTVWAFSNAGALDNVVYKRYRLLNKSLTTFDSLFVCQWSDPDVGRQGDDFVGSDTTLDMTYAYNSGPVDHEYNPFPPPAVGHRFINVRATAAFYLESSLLDPDPTPTGARQWFNLFQGLLQTTGQPFTHPSYPGDTTRFWLDGDPVARTGRLDGAIDNPGNRKMGVCAGPFILTAGDSLVIVVASVAAMGGTFISSISELRNVAAIAHSNYGASLISSLPAADITTSYPNPFQAELHFLANCAGAQSVTASLWRDDNTIVSSISLFDDGLHGDSIAGDGNWANSALVVREPSGMFLRLVVVDSLGQNILWERLVEHLPTLGPVRAVNPRVFSDNLNGDGEVNPGENVRYGFGVANDGLFEASSVRVIPLNGDIKYFQLSSIPAGSSDSLVYEAGDSVSYGVFVAPSNGIFSIPVIIADTNHNQWIDTIRFPIVPFETPVHGTPLNHANGRAEWGLNIVVVDSTSVIDHEYEITIADSIDLNKSRGFTLRDVTSGSTILSNHALPDQFSHNIPVVNGFKILRGSEFETHGLRPDSTRWISSNPAWFEGDMFTSDPHSAFGGGATTGYQLGVRYLGSFESVFDHWFSNPVEVRFDQSISQKAYRLRRVSQYVISAPNEFIDVPFTVWDMSNPSAPRQLTLAWRDENNNGVWDPQVNDDGYEIVFIYNKTYDPTGATQFSMPPNAIPNECTVGPNADVVYGLSLAVLPGHVLNEAPGTLYLRPHYPLTSDDRFTFTPTVVLDAAEPSVPFSFALIQNYPNPFNPSTTIRYEIPVRSAVRISIYNILGQCIATLLDEIREPGQGFVRWNGMNSNSENVASGVYFYRIQAGTLVTQKKMLLVR